MPPEAVHNEASKDVSKKKKRSSSQDPIVFGVSLPIRTTVSAASEVKDAWATALVALVAAAKAKANSVKAKTSEAVDEIKA